jgi:hypothetical protein
MLNTLKESLWTQFGASIDMLKNAITAYPEDHWDNNRKFFYIAYHTLVFLDYYLTIPHKNHPAPLPFTLAASEAEIDSDALDDIMPDRIYSKNELLDYLQLNREKCRQAIAGLTEEQLKERWIEDGGDMNYAVLEILLYNMRHVQHHAAQLNMLLRKQIGSAPGWVSRAKDGM